MAGPVPTLKGGGNFIYLALATLAKHENTTSEMKQIRITTLFFVFPLVIVIFWCDCMLRFHVI